jgi:hypothetical protein
MRMRRIGRMLGQLLNRNDLRRWGNAVAITELLG